MLPDRHKFVYSVGAERTAPVFARSTGATTGNSDRLAFDASTMAGSKRSLTRAAA